jgi:hypothetical protein
MPAIPDTRHRVRIRHDEFDSGDQANRCTTIHGGHGIARYGERHGYRG